MTNCYVSGSRKENPRLVYLALALSIKILVSWKADGGSYTVPLVQFDQGSSAINSRADISSGVELRILPLGDSITHGFQSTDDAGYRSRLYNSAIGTKIQFVGSLWNGEDPFPASERYHEGHDGAVINAIANYAKNSLPARPNVVLLHAGTNDMNGAPGASPVSECPGLIGDLIDEILQACPDATVIVAQIIMSRVAQTEANREQYNAALPGIIDARASEGKHVLLVNMDAVQDSDMFDQLHPDDTGYQKMADIWLNGLKMAVGKGWIKAPVGADPSAGRSGETCPSLPGWQAWGQESNGNLIASGIGTGGDHVFHNNWKWIGEIASGLGNGTGVQLGDLNGDGKADYLWIDPKNGDLYAAISALGDGESSNFTFPNGLDPIYRSGASSGKGIHMVDVNGDGLVDYLYVSDNGAVTAVFNNGYDSTASGKWSWAKKDTPIASGVDGANQETVLFADINGDDRADYIVKSKEGSLTAWLNTGTYGSTDITWTPFGEIAGGPGQGNVTIALSDITGDGRADYLIIDKEGGLSGYLNIRTKNEGKPEWVPQGGSSPAEKFIAGGISTKPVNLRFADMDGNGLDDYIIVEPKTGAISVYLNLGKADTSVIGDGIRFADLDGDGAEDYLFLGPNGELTAYLNKGTNSAANLGWDWVPVNGGKPIATGIGYPRSQVILADLNGDGRVDYCGAEKKSGALTCYLNAGPSSTNGWGWINFDDAGFQNPIATGLGESDGVRLVSFSGSKRADYIWLDKKGAIPFYYQNELGENPRGWVAHDNIAQGIGGARSAIRLSDMDGDGKSDYLWVKTLNGAVIYYRNEIGAIAPNWVQMNDGSPIASGIGFSGPNVQFADLNADGRKDYIGVDPSSGAIVAYQNLCFDLPTSPGGGGSSGGGGPGGSGGSSSAGGTTTSGNGGASAPTDKPLSVTGVTIPGYTTIGSPTVPTGIPHSGTSAIAALVAQASSARFLLKTAGDAIDLLATEDGPSSDDVRAVADGFALVFKTLETLTAEVNTIDTSSLSGSDLALLQQLQDSKSGLGPLLDIVRNDLSTVAKDIADPASSSSKSDFQKVDDDFKDGGDASKLTSQNLTPLSQHASGDNGDGGSSDGGNGGSGGTPTGCQVPGITLPPLITIGCVNAPPTMPTAGIDAVTDLQPMAAGLSRQFNTFTGEMSALASGSGGLPDFEVATQNFANFFEGLGSMVAQLENIDLSTLPGNALNAIRNIRLNAISLLSRSRDVLEDLVSLGLQKPLGAKLKAGALKIVTGITAPQAVGGIAVIGILAAVWAFPNSATDSNLGICGTDPGSTDPDVRQQYIFTTIPETKVFEFRTFIKVLPDKGTGQQMVYPNLNFQAYVTCLTAAEATKINNQDLVVDLITRNAQGGNAVSDPPPRDAPGIPARSKQPDPILQKRITWPMGVRSAPNFFHTKLASQLASQSLSNLQDESPQTAYKYDPRLGDGTNLFIFDDGFLMSHVDLQGVNWPTSYVASGLTTDSGHPVTDLLLPDDGKSHGTAMASVAFGRYFGLGLKSTFIPVRVLAGEIGYMDPIINGFMWALNYARNLPGPKVFSFSLTIDLETCEPMSPASHSRHGLGGDCSDPIIQILEDAWAADIVFTACAGNQKNGPLNIGTLSPQRYGTPNNPLITVGGIEADGSISDITARQGPSQLFSGNPITATLVGSITTYGSITQVAANSGDDRSASDETGTSGANAYVAGLAAYLLGLPDDLPNLQHGGTVAMDVKNFIVSTSFARDDARQGGPVATNLAPYFYCLNPNVIQNVPRDLARRQDMKCGPSAEQEGFWIVGLIADANLSPDQNQNYPSMYIIPNDKYNTCGDITAMAAEGESEIDPFTGPDDNPTQIHIDQLGNTEQWTAIPPKQNVVCGEDSLEMTFNKTPSGFDFSTQSGQKGTCTWRNPVQGKDGTHCSESGGWHYYTWGYCVSDTDPKWCSSCPNGADVC